ncbi:acyltransferase family protein [Mycolicibacterium porcinum]|uniref:acyltransferase family protein n=1 Tax=Mycolicibacterium porcinum TaxID=39693 RepID=UPI00256F1A2E|nr:acyltransferase family protein [Mycolicibacterium porcinum]
MRAASICVVVLWHWTLSITHWDGDYSLVMPNPIGYVPGKWALTWVLQVMPVFFIVGGYANLAGWQAVTRDGAGAARFLGARMRRLLTPLLPFLAVWVVFDLVVQATGRRSVLEWGIVVFVPLWFIGVYAAVVAAVPLTARLHQAWGWRVPVVLAATVLAADMMRLGPGWGGPVPGLVGSACVWLYCHQLGYFWRDGTLPEGGRPAAAAVALAGFAGLVVLTTFGPYSRSMVAVQGEDTSNMFPTTAPIAALATFQLGLVMLARPRLNAWLQRRGPWRAVVAANGVTMPVFTWHMTALVAFLWLYERAGFALYSEPTAEWWLTRPIWIVGPGVLLAGILAALAGSRFIADRRPRRRRGG